MRGRTREVGGFISESRRKNIVRATRMDTDSVIFSPLDDGRQKTRTARQEMDTHGMMRFSV